MESQTPENGVYTEVSAEAAEPLDRKEMLVLIHRSISVAVVHDGGEIKSALVL